MTLAVQEFLGQYPPHRGLEYLEKDFSIKVVTHPQCTNLVLLKYDIGAPMGQQIVRECRGLILEKRTWQVTCMAMTKFFNAGEHWADPIDWDTARVEEKRDGSLCCLWWYDGWRVSTSGHPSAGGPVMKLGITFEQLFWQAWEAEGYSLPAPYKPYTYFFELTSQHNRHVVRYATPRLTLLGVRNLVTLEEEDPRAWGELLGWRRVKSYDLHNLDEIRETFKDMSPVDQEGYVVVDGIYRRLKVKSPAYVALHHAKDQCSDRKFLDLIRSGESTEFLAYFPEYRAQFDRIRDRYEQKVKELEEAWERHKGLEDKKEFALAVKDLPLSGALFAMKIGKASSVRDHLSKVPLPSLEKHIL